MSDPLSSVEEGGVAFGPFRLIPDQQLLLEADAPIRLGSRAFEILRFLAERPGELVTKEELVARVWPNTFVEEGNLRVHIGALRRALRDGQDGRRFIANVPGRGYQLVAPVRKAGRALPAATATTPAALVPSLFPPPTADGRVIGRTAVLESVLREIGRRRLVTIAGPGGIGKTTVALAAVDQLGSVYPDGIYFLDLATLAEPKQIASAVAAVVGFAVRSDQPLPGLISFLKDRQTLLVLDSCEHVVDAAAELSDALIRGTASLHVVATSREPLRVEGERIIRLPPLAVPESLAGLTARDALQYPAVELFVERAAARLDSFEFSDALAPIVAAICVKLDGIPLALELAAGRVDAFGVSEIAERINDRFALLTRGKRTALLRHQTLQSTLDWSYDLLSEVERVTLRDLGVFSAGSRRNRRVAIMADALPAHPKWSNCRRSRRQSLLIADTSGGTVLQALNSRDDYAVPKARRGCECIGALARPCSPLCDMLSKPGRLGNQNTAEWLAHLHAT
jgi:predicted ATPase/DNA-binding winged helix-turn-helix (wHTH) protein